MKAPQMARDYQQMFSSLAHDYQITLAAGLRLLPALHIGRWRTAQR